MENEWKILHKLIKKIEDDMEKLSFNTSVSAFMIAVNELMKLQCNKRKILEPMIILISSFAPHIAEELWRLSGHQSTIIKAKFPLLNADYLQEDSFEYPVSINGKTRTKQRFPADIDKESVEKEILENEIIQKWIEGKNIRKIVFVPNKIINIVVG